MKDLQTALRESAPFIEKGNGTPELFAVWMLAAVAGFDAQDNGRIRLDPEAILDGRNRALEHLHVLPDGTSSAEDRIVQEIRSRIASKTDDDAHELVVFIEGLGTDWFATRVAERLPNPVRFDAIWVITQQKSRAGEHVYGVSQLDLSAGHCPVWFITIGRKFDRWTVRQIN